MNEKRGYGLLIRLRLFACHWATLVQCKSSKCCYITFFKVLTLIYPADLRKQDLWPAGIEVASRQQLLRVLPSIEAGVAKWLARRRARNLGMNEEVGNDVDCLTFSSDRLEDSDKFVVCACSFYSYYIICLLHF
jgi:hypothetical protein